MSFNDLIEKNGRCRLMRANLGFFLYLIYVNYTCLYALHHGHPGVLDTVFMCLFKLFSITADSVNKSNILLTF